MLLLGAVQRTAASPALSKRETCEAWDVIDAGGAYTLYQNQWGKSQATSGWQCTGLDYQNGNEVSWHTSWDWQGGPGQVKSYSNVAYKLNARQLGSISSIPTSWDWSYSGSNFIADVSYDIFTSYSANGPNAFEIMIWLAAAGGAGPISSTGSPISTVNIAGTNWNLFKGPNGSTTVFSFVAENWQTNFKADLNDFFKYLINNQGLPSSTYVSEIGAGTEPFSSSGTAQLTTTYFRVSVN
ncbi:glycoside hydrolase family 12 protein [Oidiodendron maius Zn]|uniref:Glycoside hydrolase family 12 protein n=1 Tax=Oidiodendron maius (strain Zn) TaxID=913774 RepID=A0A0C3C594_OIDMZ|nr:glycoside hydrolase family 12 protein [Oidiodendron maius Zn]